jgi:hypothetical protein
MHPPKPTDTTFSRAEREALVGQMSPADWARAESLARLASLGSPDMGPDDMLQQALTDLLGSERVWRRGVSVLVTLKVAMRSIASNSRKKAENARRDRHTTVTTGEGEGQEDGGPTVQTVDGLSPQDIAENREELAQIEKLVEGNAEEELVLTAWYMGYVGTEAQKETGLTAHQYDAARQRLMRKLKAHAAARKTK